MNSSTLIKSFTWEVLNRTVLKFKKARKYPFSNKYEVLNVGCGLDNPPNSLGLDGGVYVLYKYLPRFVLKNIYKRTNNSDNYSLETLMNKIKRSHIIHHDLNYGLPFYDGSVPYIFTSHFLEHLYYEDAEKFLKESYRVLKPGGAIRICIPSLDEAVAEIRKAIQDYDKGEVVTVQRYVTVKDNAYKDPFFSHKHMYNFKEVSRILSGVGFTNIIESSFNGSHIPNFKGLDTRHGLMVEASKSL